jgi:mono/diheme cytochrome c family protein
MAKTPIIGLTIAVMAASFGIPSRAQDTDPGKTAYLSSCAPCHGTDAKGGGTLAFVYKLRMPDLTVIAKRNDGRYPARGVSEVIDGMKLVEAHGTREMPIWGFDVMVSARRAAIVDYLGRIQEK